MNGLRVFVAGIMVCMLAVCARADDKKQKPDYAKLLVGRWDVTRDSQGPPRGLAVGMTFEFGKDGRMETMRRENGSVATGYAYYKVKDDKIRYRGMSPKGVGKPEDFTIKKITERELVLEFEKDQTIEFKRKK